MSERFKSLQQREQVIIVLGAILLLAFSFYWIVWMPLYEAQMTERRGYAQSREQNEIVLKVANQILALQERQAKENSPASNPLVENLTSYVNQSLQERQLALTQIQQLSADQLQLRLENAAFSSVLAWIYDLENTPGLLLGEITIRPAATTQTGRVNITVGLSRVN